MYSNKPLETIIKGKFSKAEDRWYPNSVDNYKMAFNKLDMTVANSQALKSNLAYSMQYLEYLEKQLSEVELSSVLYVMTVKSYVITGMSILEGLFSNIVRSKGWWKMSTTESLGTVTANKKRFGEHELIVKTELCKEVASYEMQMNMDELIKKLENHHEALEVNHLVYPALRRLKDLRNRIHLQKLESETDHDYNAFDLHVKKEMGSILFQILTSNMVTDLPDYFEFLKLNETTV
ncbi:MAG: hypothetical protein MJ177_05615 [Clostridia bacterium]|nr:hypothetical protein [Clostridia bacterium]